jgi:hypothetical protein
MPILLASLGQIMIAIGFVARIPGGAGRGGRLKSEPASILLSCETKKALPGS